MTLRAAELGIHSPSAALVEEVSFTVEPGERVGLIGESGSGKSLLAAAIMGLLPPGLTATGSVRLAGRELLGAGERTLSGLRGRSMAMVFQEPMSALNPAMRVGRQVAEAMLLHATQPGRRAARSAAVDLLDRVRLPDPERIARAYPHQLSGGQRQRVVLAIALANDPALLICDEPTTALDVTVQASILELIVAASRDRDRSLLFITHDLAVVAEVCERVLVLYRGRVVEQGSTGQVLRAPEHEYTRRLLAASSMEVG
ncbi:ABC transporter ATP-binding protein [Amycolatopsis aidingensis]|uniref:ABC transporter ATP-binding protein n=1 Tax=Amycolatopsis aidingensis TaxID=2842453 RepID=UPI001C0C8998|nr:ABC transporter ATP-binding protein [Amycolatopsis aidingensis]